MNEEYNRALERQLKYEQDRNLYIVNKINSIREYTISAKVKDVGILDILGEVPRNGEYFFAYQTKDRSRKSVARAVNIRELIINLTEMGSGDIGQYYDVWHNTEVDYFRRYFIGKRA